MNVQANVAQRVSSEKPEEIDLDSFLADPIGYFGFSMTRMQTIPPALLAEVQLAGMKKRFGQLRHSLPMLQRLADVQKIDKIDKLDDVLPVLFTHATYKSYPASLLDKQRFGQLTAWLGKLTTIDLSKVDASSCRSIDDWMALLRRETPLSICHTSGTSGTMSFLPWSKQDWSSMMRWFPVNHFQQFGVEPPASFKLPLNVPCIYPFYRYGGSAHTLANDYFVETIAGSEDRFHAAYPSRLSADVLLLAAKVRAAAAKGQLDQLKISPELAARRAEFEAQQRDMPQHVANFFTTMRTKLAGQRVFMMATPNLLYTMSENGLKQGMKSVFDPSSVIVTGGGGKGIVLPPNWEEPIKKFFGVEHLRQGFGMSEISGQYFMCEHGHYHGAPWVIPFLLDPDSGATLPRTGTVTGRFAFFDLLPDTHWGGFVSGDEVTITWEPNCPCGRQTPYVHNKIQRISEKKNDEGEEKITCAATPGAYEEALDFLKDVSN